MLMNVTTIHAVRSVQTSMDLTSVTAEWATTLKRTGTRVKVSWYQCHQGRKWIQVPYYEIL